MLQAVVLILEGTHSAEVKEQALCILANIGDGESAKEYIMANEDVLKKLTDYMVSTVTINCSIVLTSHGKHCNHKLSHGIDITW
jgi:hypothetical protein